MAGRTVRLGAEVGAVALITGGAAAQQGVDVRDDSFAAAIVTVTEGGAVTWTQSGTNPHTVTADDGSFDSVG